MATTTKYQPTIGIETHVQLKTKTKLFAAVGNDASKAEPNTLISHICVGLPGALPVLNQEALKLAARAAFALNTKPQAFSKFDRKHYFYPDLPKGYQITQYEDPIIKGGHVDLEVDGQPVKVGITRVHLEEDAGKNTHPTGTDYSLVDLNRAGTPLLEIVSEPDMHSAAQAKAYVRELYLLMKYADVSDADLYLGHIRFDVNVSVSAGDKLGTRAEVKNLNSFRSVENAVNFEINRQTELLQKGEKVVQETRGWDEAKQKTTSQRSKEEAQDYRYMPEPDIPPIEFTTDQIENFQKDIVTLPKYWRKVLEEAGVARNSIETLLEREGEYGISYLTKIRDALVVNANLAAFIAKYIINDYFKITSDIKKITDGAQPTSPYLPTLKQFGDIFSLIENNKISSNSAVMLLYNAHSFPADTDLLAQAKNLNLIQVSDEEEIGKIVAKVIAENPKVVADIKAGQEKAIGFLVGQVMAKSKGQANPGLAQKLIKEQISRLDG